MTDFIDMTKADLAAIIGGMTTSQIKKASHADLVQRAGELSSAKEPTPAAILDNSSILTPTDDDVLAILKGLTPAEHHLLWAFAHCENTVVNAAPKNATCPTDLTTWVWLDDRKVGDMTIRQKKGVLSSLVKKNLVHVSPDSDGDMLGWSQLGFEVVMSILDDELPALTKPADTPVKKQKAAPEPKRTRGADCILFLPMDAQKEPKEGTKRAAILDLLRKPAGTTLEEIAAATGWSRAVAGSGLYVDVKLSGYGVERREGRLHLLPEGVK